MNAVSVPESTESTGRLLSFTPRASAEQVQETIGQLQQEVQRLQAQLVQTRQDLEHRIALLRNSQLRERELRSDLVLGERGQAIRSLPPNCLTR